MGAEGSANYGSEYPPDFEDPRSPLKGRSPVPWAKRGSRTNNSMKDVSMRLQFNETDDDKMD